MLTRLRSFSISLTLILPAFAQTSPTVAGSGYRTPANTITAAPGQVMMVSVFGLATRFPTPAFPTPDNGYPTEIQGVSVDFVQGPVTVQLQISGIQQSACPATGACSPATSLTLQIPYELNPDSTAKAALRVKESGAVAAEVVLNPVTDNAHVLNTCDQTGVYLSIAYGTPADSCVPMVMHARGPLVSQTAPAKPGETLVAWLYGLGAIDHPVPSNCCAFPDQLPLALQPFYVSFSYADSGRFPMRRLGQTVPSYVGMVGAGLYQVQFAIPNVPSNLSPCTGRSGNLRIMVTGPNSADGAEICVQP